jgi:hypothetical protein
MIRILSGDHIGLFLTRSEAAGVSIRPKKQLRMVNLANYKFYYFIQKEVIFKL